VLLRGFRKFTGLTATDEDEESGATDKCEDFYFAPKAAATRFAVTTKSNGENGKFAVRELLFAGSKNTCVVWGADQDVTTLHPAGADASIPGPLIAAQMQAIWRGWAEDTRKTFVERSGSAGWTLMLEHNCSQHEHVFPIARDFVEFVAVLDREGLPLPQREAFAFFDEFRLPRVRCEECVPIAELPSRLVAERAAVDREGAVLYLETEEGAPVALVKVKSDFYVRARRTRQTFWGAVIDPLLKGQALEGDGAEVGDDTGLPIAKGKGKGRGKRAAGCGWEAVERRLCNGMKELKHVEGCAEQWKDWADVAVGFVHWWRRKYEALSSEAEKRTLVEDAKNRFGTTYRDYCRSAGLPGGEN